LTKTTKFSTVSGATLARFLFPSQMKIKTYTFRDIEALREQKKVKKKELCHAIGRHVTMYSAWDSGKSRISLDDANKCINYLNSVQSN
jgi:DNA-binding transcriptional regulator YiaG